jgi:AcrR family transcriptional regulator
MTDLPEPPRRPAGSRRTGRPRTLDRDAVVDAALRVLDADGLDAVTIRRVAEELGTSGTALYTYVRDKEELVDLLVDRVIGEIDVGAIPESLPWQEQLRQAAHAMRNVFVAHGDIARATLARVPQGERSLVVMESMLARLRAGGLPDTVISLGMDMLALYVGGVAFEESIWMSSGMSEAEAAAFGDNLRAYFESLPTDRFPTLVALAPALTTADGEDRFEFGLAVIVAGLEAQAARAKRSA